METNRMDINSEGYRDPIAEECKSCPAKDFCDEAVLEKEHTNDR